MRTSSRNRPAGSTLLSETLAGLGSRIVIARKVRSLTQADLALSSGVGISTIASLEAGHPGVSVGNLLKVVNGLDLLGQVDDWLDPAKDAEVVSFATSKLGGRRFR